MAVLANRRFAGRSVLILSPGVPHRSQGASSVLFFHYIRGIAETGCRVLHLLLIDRSNEDDARLREYVDEMARLRNVTVVPCAFDRLYFFSRWTRTPRVGAFSPDCVERVRQFAPDCVVAFDVLSAAYALTLDLGVKQLVWLGDLNFDTFWYHAVYDARERLTAAARLPFIGLLCLQWQRFYRRTLGGVDSIVVASKSSEGPLRRLGLTAKYLPYPWPTDAGPVHHATTRQKKPSFAFFGSLSGLGSRSAFHSLLTEVYPALVRIWGQNGFEISLAGSRQIPEWVRVELERKSEIVFHGFVEDLSAFLRRCHAAVIPIVVPVGNRSRIITAMAHGALVIAHRNTALGNPHLVSGENCFLACDPSEFVAHMQFSVDHAESTAVIRQRARETYERFFAPASAVACLIEEIVPLLPDPPALAQQA